MILGKFYVYFLLSSVGELMYEMWWDSNSKITHKKMLLKNIHFDENKLYSTGESLSHIHISYMHPSHYNTCITKKNISNAFRTTTWNQNKASFNQLNRRMNKKCGSFFHKKCFKKEKKNLFPKKNSFSTPILLTKCN